MKRKIIALSNTTTSSKNKTSILEDVIINNPESKMRVGIKEVEEAVKEESRNRRINAPSTVEERMLLSN